MLQNNDTALLTVYVTPVHQNCPVTCWSTVVFTPVWAHIAESGTVPYLSALYYTLHFLLVTFTLVAISMLTHTPRCAAAVPPFFINKTHC